MTCNWWIQNITVNDKQVNFYIGVSNESWSIVLKNSSSVVEASKSGYSYGNHSLTATSYGSHTLELNCDWKSPSQNPCEICSFEEIKEEIIMTPKPTNLKTVCDPLGNKVTISWDPVTGANFYAIRVNNWDEPWDESCSSPSGDFCKDITTTSHTFNVTPGKTYNWWVHAIKGGIWSEAVGMEFTCKITKKDENGLGNTMLIVVGAGIGLGVLYYLTKKK